MGRPFINRPEISHLSFRRCERALLRFGRKCTFQTVGFIHAAVHHPVPTDLHLLGRGPDKRAGAATLAVWRGLLAA
jgi:hypothetical protein